MQKSCKNTLGSFLGATFRWFIDSPLAYLAQLYMAVGQQKKQLQGWVHTGQTSHPGELRQGLDIEIRLHLKCLNFTNGSKQANWNGGHFLI